VILDTDALSGAADGDPGALEIIAAAERIAVPGIVLGEYRLGIAQSRHRKEYEEWLREWADDLGHLRAYELTYGEQIRELNI